jgi:hypothetical protein
MTSPPFPVPTRIDRLQQIALGVGLLGGLACLVGLALDPHQFFRSYLFAYLFWAGVAVGCMSIVMIHHLSGGLWGLVIRRLLEAGTRTLLVVALLFIPVALGMGRLYPWVHPGEDKLLQYKAVYLNVPFFLGRAAFYFATWLTLAHFLNKWSRQLDEGEDPKVSRRLQGLSGAGLIVLGLTITFSSVDWAMSLAPHWFSTIYGILFMVGQVLSAMALVIVLLAFLGGERPLSEAVRPGPVHDLGKLLLAFVMLWAYVNLSQFLITWSGNLAEEAPFYIHRLQGGWQWVALALVVFHFALPFLLLLSRNLKRDARLLGLLAVGVFLVRLLDLYWLVAPDLIGHGHEAVGLGVAVHWLDVAAPLGLGGIWLFFFAQTLRDRPLLPVGEPEIRALLATPAGGTSR